MYSTPRLKISMPFVWRGIFSAGLVKAVVVFTTKNRTKVNSPLYGLP